jgi:hypothetical protein
MSTNDIAASLAMRGRPLAERWAAKVQKTETCWLWTGAISSTGYGRLNLYYAHRIAFELHIGPIPEGMTIDHLCRVRTCVNPAHLEAVTLAENIRRSDSPSAQRARWTHCPRGHEFTPENTYLRPDGHGRQCRACCRMRQRLR